MWSLILLTSMAFANGDRVGNGGKGILCVVKGDHKEVQVLDLYESTLPTRDDYKKKSREKVLEMTFENLKRLAPSLGKQYTNRSSKLMDEIEFKPKADLSETPDSLQLSLPGDSNCKLKQLAIRRLQSDLMTKPFLFSKDLWDVMDSEQQAGLLLHEIVYEHFSKLGEKDSVKARKITAYLMSEKSTKDSPDEFWKLIQSMRLPIYR